MNLSNNNLPDCRILVVDDEPNELKSLVIGLKLEGFDAVAATNGKEALELLMQKNFNITLMDLMMPDMNGLQLARKIRGDFPSVKTVLMSAYHISPVQLARSDTGVIGFVQKPFDFSHLIKFFREKLSELDNDNTNADISTPYCLSSNFSKRN